MSNDQNPNLYPVRVVDESTPQALDANELAAQGYYRQGPVDGNEPTSSFGMREVMYIIFSHKIKILMIFIVGVMMTISFVKNYPEYYESQTNIKIKSSMKSITLDAGADQIASTSGSGSNERHEIAILESYGLAEEVVDNLGVNYVLYGPDWEAKLKARAEAKAAAELEEPTITQKIAQAVGSVPKAIKENLNLVKPDMTLRERAIKTVQGRLVVKPTMSQSGVMEVSYASPSPVLAKSILDEVVRTYLSIKERMRQLPLDSDKFDEKAAEYERILKEKQELLAKKRSDAGILDAEQQEAILFTQLQSLEGKVSEASVEARAINERISWIDTMLTNRDKQDISMDAMQALDNPYRDFLQKKIWELQLQENELLATFKPKSTEVQLLRNRIKVLRDEMNSSMNFTEGTSGTLTADPVKLRLDQQKQEAQVQLAEIKARLKASNDEIASVSTQIKNMRLHKQDVQKLVREIDSLEKQFASFQDSIYLQRTDSALAGMINPNVNVLFPPTTPVGTTKNTRKLMALLGFGIFMSLVGGLVLAFGLELMNNTMKTTEEVERWLDLPVLMTIPHGKGHKPERDVA